MFFKNIAHVGFFHFHFHFRCKDAVRVSENLESRRCEDAKMRSCGEGFRKSGEPKLRSCEYGKLRRGYQKIWRAQVAKMRRCDAAAAPTISAHTMPRRCEDAKMWWCKTRAMSTQRYSTVEERFWTLDLALLYVRQSGKHRDETKVVILRSAADVCSSRGGYQWRKYSLCVTFNRCYCTLGMFQLEEKYFLSPFW